MGNVDTAKAFLAGVLSKLPESLRGQAEAAFNDAQAAAALEEMGAGVARQSDYSRQMDALREQQQTAQTLYDNNVRWYEANKAEVEAAATLRAKVAELEGRPAPAAPPVVPATPAIDPTKFVSVEHMSRIASDAVNLIAASAPLVVRHQQMFGEVLDLPAVMERAQKDRVDVDVAYKAMYAQQLKEKADQAEAARIKAIEDNAIARFRQANPQMPYPSPRETGASPLDGFRERKPDAPPVDLVAESIALYDSLVAQKTGAGA